MTALSADLTHRLLYILHAGLCRARNLALGGNTQQTADLTDALEIVPALMDNWQDGHLDRIRSILRDYQGKYPGDAFNYLAHLDEYAPPVRF